MSSNETPLPGCDVSDRSTTSSQQLSQNQACVESYSSPTIDQGKHNAQYHGLFPSYFLSSRSPIHEVYAVTGVRHVHHSYIWLGGIGIVGAVVGTLILSSINVIIATIIGFGESSSFVVVATLIGAICGIVMLSVFIFILRWWSWRHLFCEIGEKEFTLSSGIFNKKCVHVPYRRVQSVDLSASLIQRVLGICTLSIDTAGGVANKAVIVPYVQRFVAERIRAELFSRKLSALAEVDKNEAVSAAKSERHILPSLQAVAADGSPTALLDAPAELWKDMPAPFAGESAYADLSVSYEYGLSNKELLLTSLSNASVVGFVLVICASLIAYFVAPTFFGLLDLDVFTPDASSVTVQMFGVGIPMLVTVGVVAVAIVTWMLSVLGICVSFGGFRARRCANRIEVERGLLQHQASSIDIDRVQSVIIKQGFIRRLIGYCELSLGKIDASSVDEKYSQQHMSAVSGFVVHPCVKLDRVPEILNGLVPDYADVPVDLHPLPRIALRRAIMRRAFLYGSGLWLAVTTSIIMVFLLLAYSNPELATVWHDPAIYEAQEVLAYVAAGLVILYVLSFMLFVIDVVGAFLWFQYSGFAYNERFMCISNGGFSCNSISFPRQKIQFGYTCANPLQRLAETVTICVRTAAGVRGTTTCLIDVALPEATAWLSWLEPAAHTKSIG